MENGKLPKEFTLTRNWEYLMFLGHALNKEPHIEIPGKLNMNQIIVCCGCYSMVKLIPKKTMFKWLRLLSYA
jgi:hypothetical protein